MLILPSLFNLSVHKKNIRANTWYIRVIFKVLVFNAIFNNISAISWWPVLL
jgi:hypothetical protein